MSHGDRKVSHAAIKVSHGARKVSHGAGKVSHGAGKVFTVYCKEIKEMVCDICGYKGRRDNLKKQHLPKKHPGKLYSEKMTLKD